jgi:hypothetical protein
MQRSPPKAFVLLQRFLLLFIPINKNAAEQKIEIPVRNRRLERKIQESGGLWQEYAT